MVQYIVSKPGCRQEINLLLCLILNFNKSGPEGLVILALEFLLELLKDYQILSLILTFLLLLLFQLLKNLFLIGKEKLKYFLFRLICIFLEVIHFVENGREIVNFVLKVELLVLDTLYQLFSLLIKIIQENFFLLL